MIDIKNIEVNVDFSVSEKNSFKFEVSEKTISHEVAYYDGNIKFGFYDKPKLSKSEIMMKTIQNLLDHTKNELKTNNFHEVKPLLFLLNTYNYDLIEKLSKEKGYSFKDVYKSIISDVFDRNLRTSINNAIKILNDKKNAKIN